MKLMLAMRKRLKTSSLIKLQTRAIMASTPRPTLPVQQWRCLTDDPANEPIDEEIHADEEHYDDTNFLEGHNTEENTKFLKGQNAEEKMKLLKRQSKAHTGIIHNDARHDVLRAREKQQRYKRYRASSSLTRNREDQIYIAGICYELRYFSEQRLQNKMKEETISNKL